MDRMQQKIENEITPAISDFGKDVEKIDEQAGQISKNAAKTL